MQTHILLVEGDPAQVVVIAELLRPANYLLSVTANGSDAIGCLSRSSFDLIVLDAALPNESGFEVCRQVCSAGAHAPILMLSDVDGAEGCVMALRLGADDCLRKPFDESELLARIEALLRRARDPRPDLLTEFRFGEVHVDFLQGTAWRSGAPLMLTNRELRLLRYLVTRRGTIVPRQELLEAVWDYRGAISRTLDVHISGLRLKVEPVPHQPRFIRTVRRKGYLFQEAGSSAGRRETLSAVPPGTCIVEQGENL